MEKITLLYITYIDPNHIGNSGSSVRPLHMLHAFQKMDIDIKVLYGTNSIKKLSNRKKNVSEVINWLDDHSVDICYIEPPSGPMFCQEDRKLLKILHSKNIPIAVFYRDCYWMFPDIYEESGMGMLKKKLIHILSKKDLRLYHKVCSMMYYPSETMAELIPQYTDWDDLPPGAERLDINDAYAEDIQRLKAKNRIKFFFVGGATKRYGIDILLDSMQYLNNKECKAELILVCPAEQWEAFEYRKKFEEYGWLHVYHLHPGKELENLYKESDICVIPKKKELYSDFAVNVKLFEYISHEKPILTTNCFEVSKIVSKYDIGWIVKDDPRSMCEKMLNIISDVNDIINKKENCKHALEKNTWDIRANKVIEDLLKYRVEK